MWRLSSDEYRVIRYYHLLSFVSLFPNSELQTLFHTKEVLWT